MLKPQRALSVLSAVSVALVAACSSAVPSAEAGPGASAAASQSPNQPPSPSATPTTGPALSPTPASTPTALPTSSPAATPGTVRLMIAGDVMLARSIGARVRQDPSAPFAGVSNIFAKADLTLVNLECTISNLGEPWVPKHFTFRAPPKAIQSLTAAGVDLVDQANNHGMDYGRDAYADTRQRLADAGIQVIGAGADKAQARAPVIVEQNELRIAFLAYLGVFTDTQGWDAHDWEATGGRSGVALMRKRQVVADVSAAKQQADVVVVMFHTGTEMSQTPTKLQRGVSQAAIDAGASLVVSAHPHVLQGSTRTERTLIAYSLGNFVFDRISGIATDSVILDVTLSTQGVDTVDWIPIVIRDGFPQRARGADADRIRAEVGPI